MNLKVEPYMLWAALLLALTVLPLAAWPTLDAATQAADRAERRLVALQELAARHQALQTPHTVDNTPALPLFDLFNRHTETAGLKNRVERLQPRPAPDPQQPDRLEARLGEAYLEPVTRLLALLEQEMDMESLVLTRTSKGLLNVDMTLARKPRQ